MTDKPQKRRKLLLEILLAVVLCFILSLLLFVVSVNLSRGLIEEYCFNHDVQMDEFDWYHLEQTLMSVGFAVSALFFLALFIVLLIERLAYIRKITQGVHALRSGDLSHRVRLQGNNELTELAEAVNYLSESEQKIKEKEQKFAQEREELIRTLSHDIRTPLTSIMSYTELLAAKDNLSSEEMREYLALVGKKSAQIKQLTDILLDGGRRELAHFDNARLLFEQLAGEFEEALEDAYSLSVTLSLPPDLAGSFDVGELRRIFDNLISNVQKYADPANPVQLSISKTESGVLIKQRNAVRQDASGAESYRMGIHSMRRIAQNYGGSAEVTQTKENFEIIIILANL